MEICSEFKTSTSWQPPPQKFGYIPFLVGQLQCRFGTFESSRCSKLPGNRWDYSMWSFPAKRCYTNSKHFRKWGQFVWSHTVDGWNPANVVYPIIYKVYTSQVVQDFFHQQYLRFSRQFWMTGWTGWDRSGKVLKNWPFSTEPLTRRRKGNGSDEFSACLRSVQSRKQKV